MKLMRKTGLLLLSFGMIFLSGCAEREPDVEVKEVIEKGGDHIVDSIGDEGFVKIDAEVISPDVPVTGKVSGTLPAVEDVETILCKEKFEESQVYQTPSGDTTDWIIWDDDGVSQKKVYTIDQYKSVYTGVKIDVDASENSTTYTKENAENIADGIMDEFGYEVRLEAVSGDGMDNRTYFAFYTNMLEGVPVYDVYMEEHMYVAVMDGTLSQAVFFRKFAFVEKNEVQIKSAEEIVEIAKTMYANGELPMAMAFVVDKIELVYYIDAEDNLKPVWAFRTHGMDDEKGTIIMCFDAVSGDLIYDLVSGLY